MIFVRKASDSKYTDIIDIYMMSAPYTKSMVSLLSKKTLGKIVTLKHLLGAGMFRLRKQNNFLIVIFS